MALALPLIDGGNFGELNYLFSPCCRQGTDGSNKSLCSFRAPGDLAFGKPKKNVIHRGKQTYQKMGGGPEKIMKEMLGE